MDQLLEFLKMAAYLLAAFAVLAWLGSGQKKRRAAKRSSEAARREGSDDELVDDMGEIGAAGGFLGGELEDLFVGRFALRRSKIARREETERDSDPEG